MRIHLTIKHKSKTIKSLNVNLSQLLDFTGKLTQEKKELLDQGLKCKGSVQVEGVKLTYLAIKIEAN